MAKDAVSPASVSPEKRPEPNKGRVTSYVVVSCIVAASGGVLFGYDSGIAGGVTATTSFLKRFFPSVYEKMQDNTHVSNYCKFRSEILTSFTSSLYIAGLIGTLLASKVTDRCGRRGSMVIGGALFLAGSAVGGAAVNIYMLILARLLLGLGIGFSNQSIPVYLSEMSPPKYRGALTGCFDISLSFGILVANLVNYGTQKIKGGWGWRISLSFAAVPSTFLIVGALFLSETPGSIILRGRGDLSEARGVLRKIRGTDDIDDELHEFATAAASATKAAEEEHPLRRIFQRKHRPHLVMAVLLPFFVQMTGINVVNLYAPVMFRTIGQKESASLLSAVITRVISLSGTLLASLALVDRVGRRPLFFAGGAVMAVAHAVLGVVLAVKLQDHGAVSSSVAYVVLALICAFIGGFGWSWGPLVWLISSEIFPMEIRSAGQGIQVAMCFLSTFAVAQSVLEMICGMRAATFFFSAGWTVLMTVFVVFFLPETNGVPLNQMEKVWRKHWYWKRFVAAASKCEERHFVEHHACM